MVESIKELRKICYKGGEKKRPLYMELVTMKISIYITKLLLYTPIRADQVTLSMILLAILGSIIMAFGTLKFILVGILIIHFTVILDNVNGEIARYRKEGNIMGSFLENSFNEICITFMFFSLSFGIFLQTGYKSAVIFGFLASIFSKSFVLPILDGAVMKNALRDSVQKRDEKVKKYSSLIGKPNIKGGSNKISRKLYKIHDYFREFWNHPFNIVHVNVIVILEIINSYYRFLPAYSMLYWYLVIYGTGSLIIQTIAFIANYKGKSVYHYYLEVFGKG